MAKEQTTNINDKMGIKATIRIKNEEINESKNIQNFYALIRKKLTARWLAYNRFK
jgi:hypothetical protein